MERLPDKYKPITPLGYVGYNILFSVPLIGWIFWLVACFDENINVRNYARSFLIPLLVALIIVGIGFLIAYGLGYYYF